MKKALYTIIIAAAAVAATGCADMLNTSPTNQIASGNMWTTPALADKGMNGLYEAFYNRKQNKGTQIRHENMDGLNKYGIEGLGFCTDYFSNNYPLELLSREQKRANDVQMNHEWMFCYTIVHAANDAIVNLHKAGLDEATYQRYLCEAHFLRAWAYSRLNEFWWGVPIYTTPVSNEQCNKTQDKPFDVWNLVLEDLTFCIGNENFPDETISKYLGRPSKGAAYALRGTAYMWMAAKDEDGKQRPDGDAKAAEYYELAEKDFAKVGEMGYALFQGKYIDFFTPENEHDPEMIFAIQYDDSQGFRDNIQQALGARDTFGGWTEVKPSADFVDYFENADGSKFDWSKVTWNRPYWGPSVAYRPYNRGGVTGTSNHGRVDNGRIVSSSSSRGYRGSNSTSSRNVDAYNRQNSNRDFSGYRGNNRNNSYNNRNNDFNNNMNRDFNNSGFRNESTFSNNSMNRVNNSGFSGGGFSGGNRGGGFSGGGGRAGGGGHFGGRR